MRKWLYKQLDAEAWPHNGLSPLNRLVTLLIVTAVTLAVLETEPTLRASYAAIFNATDTIFGVAFSIEYLARVWVAGEATKYAGLRGRVRFMLSPTALIDLIAILPFFLSYGLQDAFLLRMFRLFRLLTLAKLGRYSSALRNISGALSDRRYELLLSLFIAFVVMLFAASALHFAEGQNNPEDFGSIPRSLWWGVATMTKVGYGDAYPVTMVGKLFAAVFAIAAVGVVAMPTGILAAAFSDAFHSERSRNGEQN